jgi:hypothetical protein
VEIAIEQNNGLAFNVVDTGNETEHAKERGETTLVIDIIAMDIVTGQQCKCELRSEATSSSASG